MSLAAPWPSTAAKQAPGTVVTSLTLFAGNAAGLWRSRDWGGAWERVQAPALAELGAAHVIRPVGPGVYLGGDGGLYVSDDFGETWTRRSELKGLRALAASRYPLADPTLFAGTTQGLFKSPDDGKTFEALALQGVAVTRLEWPGPALAVASEAGVRLSDDGGATWRAAPRGLPDGRVHSLALSSYFSVDPVMFAGVGRDGVQRSSDGGRTWSAAGLDGTRVNDLLWLGPILYAATDAGLFRSEEAGRAWTRIGEGLADAAVTALLFPLAPDSGAEFFVGTSRGIFHTLDGGLRFEPTGFKDEVAVLATFPPPEPVRRKQ
jgi:photosystem II stability/assembly factor-like uncharacterized protein